jgi:acetyltransferase
MTDSKFKAGSETAHDFLRQRRHPLDAIFVPKTVALIGATETVGSVGRTLMENLKEGMPGRTLYPVNPTRATVLGVQAYPTIAALPGPVDLAVIATPARTVPEIIRQCAAARIPGAVIISAGFKEAGPPGVALEREILEIARSANMRIVGPNCLGVMVPHNKLNATFAAELARPGSVAFISQSGALCTAILDWSVRENVGFSAFVSVGSMLDVDWGDLIDYLGDDPHTRSIVVYMESIGDARSFLSAAREVALSKPIVVLKAGYTAAASKAAASHTGALAGSDAVLDAAFRRVGVLRVGTIAELFHMVDLLVKQPRPRGPRLSIVTNAGGPGVLATDMLISKGGELAELSQETVASLNEFLPAHWSHANPIDILGDAGPDRYAGAVKIAAEDPANDGLLVILTPQAMTDATATAEHLKPLAKLHGKPILASWMGDRGVAEGRAILNAANIPNFAYPDTAARAFCSMWRYSYNLRALYETPAMAPEHEHTPDGAKRTAELIRAARAADRTILTEFESKQVLGAYNIPTVETQLAESEEQAVERAAKLGYPVVLKLHSETITHKTDVGGVKLNLRDAGAVRDAYRSIETAVTEKAGRAGFQGVTVQPMIDRDGYEIILGSSIDPQFGPVLLFGSGGQLVEVFQDRALALPPLNATLAVRLMEQTRIYKALKGVRGRKPVDLAALAQLLVRFSHLVVEQPWIKEVDINPLLVSAERFIALDARVILHGTEVGEEKLPTPAIRPYPTQYVMPWQMKDGTPTTIRPIRPEDEPLLVDFHHTLSEQTVYQRYFGVMKLEKRIAHERLIRVCFNDFDREIAIVVDHQDAQTGRHEILGIGRLSRIHGQNDAEFAILVSSPWQNRGLGTQLLKTLVQIGRNEKLSRITAQILLDNIAMQHVSTKAGFTMRREFSEGTCTAEIVL